MSNLVETLDRIGHLDYIPACEVGTVAETGQPCGDTPVAIVAYHHTCCGHRDGGHACADCLSMLREEAEGQPRVTGVKCDACAYVSYAGVPLLHIDRIEPLR